MFVNDKKWNRVQRMGSIGASILIFHEVGIGVTLIVLADLAFVFSGFHDDLNWKYLYLLPRLFLNLGEMLILLKILEKYKS